MKFNDIIEKIGAELALIEERKIPKYNSAHEAYAVILEELDELWVEVKRRHKRIIDMRKEAIQVATTTIRFLMDLC